MRKFIVGTDWWTDCDDVIAMKLLAMAAREKRAELLGIGINACMQYSVASLKNYLSCCGIVCRKAGCRKLCSRACGGY